MGLVCVKNEAFITSLKFIKLDGIGAISMWN